MEPILEQPWDVESQACRRQAMNCSQRACIFLVTFYTFTTHDTLEIFLKELHLHTHAIRQVEWFGKNCRAIHKLNHNCYISREIRIRPNTYILHRYPSKHLQWTTAYKHRLSDECIHLNQLPHASNFLSVSDAHTQTTLLTCSITFNENMTVKQSKGNAFFLSSWFLCTCSTALVVFPGQEWPGEHDYCCLACVTLLLRLRLLPF